MKTPKVKTTNREIMADLRALVVGEVRAAYRGIAKVVERAGAHGSALHGLEVTAAAFAAVLDTYAAPNAENPEGMCDDPQAFRRYFAEIIASGAGPSASGAEPPMQTRPAIGCSKHEEVSDDPQ